MSWFFNISSPTQGMTKAGKGSFWLFHGDVCHSGHKAFQSTMISQKKPAVDSGKLRVWCCDLGKALRLAESLCHFLLVEMLRAWSITVFVLRNMLWPASELHLGSLGVSLFSCVLNAVLPRGRKAFRECWLGRQNTVLLFLITPISMEIRDCKS